MKNQNQRVVAIPHPNVETHIFMDFDNLKVTAYTNKGKKRDNNEDSFFATTKARTPNYAETLFAVVADGMGGHENGEQASQFVTQWCQQNIDNDSYQKYFLTMKHFRSFFEEMKKSFNAKFRDKEGTTVTAIFLPLDHLLEYKVAVGFYAQLGDSRLTRHLPDGRSHQITTDMIGYHPSQLIDALCAGSPQQFEFGMFEFRSGEAYTLCTDGITDYLGSGWGYPNLNKRQRLKLGRLMRVGKVEEVESFVEEQGSKDNHTMIKIEIP
jgi:serine/threonine protein phosphatase PrpC